MRRGTMAVAVTLLSLSIIGCAKVNVSDGLESSADITVVDPDGSSQDPNFDPIDPALVATATPVEANTVDLDFSATPNTIQIQPGDDNSPLSTDGTTTDGSTTASDSSGSTAVDPTATPAAAAVATSTPGPAPTTGPTAAPTNTTVTSGDYELDVSDGFDGLNVRDVPNGDVIGQIVTGEAVTVVGEAQINGGATWAKVQSTGGAEWSTGWVAFRFLQTAGSSTPTATPDPNVTPTATPTPDPNATATPTPTPDPNATATPTPTPTATPDPNATTTPTPTPTPTATPGPTNTPAPTAEPTLNPANTAPTELGTFVVTASVPSAQGLPILATPAIGTAAIGFAPAGATVQVISTQASYSGDVFMVKIDYAGIKGWVNASYLALP